MNCWRTEGHIEHTRVFQKGNKTNMIWNKRYIHSWITLTHINYSVPMKEWSGLTANFVWDTIYAAYVGWSHVLTFSCVCLAWRGVECCLCQSARRIWSPENNMERRQVLTRLLHVQWQHRPFCKPSVPQCSIRIRRGFYFSWFVVSYGVAKSVQAVWYHQTAITEACAK